MFTPSSSVEGRGWGLALSLMDPIDPALPPCDADVTSTYFIDAGEPTVVAAKEVTSGLDSDKERSIALFEAVRDGFRYDPYGLASDPAEYRASAILAGSQSWCIPKSILLTAAARSVGIPARLGFADVQNHLQSARLEAAMGTSLFAWHGYSVLYVDGRWLKVSSAFNRSMRPVRYQGADL
ncbi:MAG: transglutaminase-like domain-containing protein [Acidimicrobiales bacterium]